MSFQGPPRYYSLGEVICKQGVEPDPKKLHVLTEIPLIMKKNYNHL